MTELAQPSSLTIDLDAGRVSVDGKVTGRLTPAPPGGALVELVWRTSGKCEPEEKVVARDEVAPGASFALRVPAAGPMSYAGKTFSVTWFVRARTAGGGPTVEQDVTVVPAG